MIELYRCSLGRNGFCPQSIFTIISIAKRSWTDRTGKSTILYEVKLRFLRITPTARLETTNLLKKFPCTALFLHKTPVLTKSLKTKLDSVNRPKKYLKGNCVEATQKLTHQRI